MTTKNETKPRKLSDKRLAKAIAANATAGGKKDTQMQIRVSFDDKALFERAAEKNDMTLSAWILHVARIAAKLETT